MYPHTMPMRHDLFLSPEQFVEKYAGRTYHSEDLSTMNRRRDLQATRKRVG